jgi:2,3-bisphosphoglycerate-independent phosphoglycerate mutase
MHNRRKVILIVMDGWGEAPASKSNAIYTARTPFIDYLYQSKTHCKLFTSGDSVGLPDGQMGNSEVGHLNLGAGRVVYQELALINKQIKEGTLASNEVLHEAFKYCRDHKKDLHLFGLVSNGGVHSHINHLKFLCKLASDHEVRNVFIHAFTDGRDTDPRSGIDFIKELQEFINGTHAKIASVIGRYYAMDRDKRWERVKLAYDLLVHGKGEAYNDPLEAVAASYAKNITDEFIKPVVIHEEGEHVAVIKPGDAVISFNFRTDRCREITQVLTQKPMADFEMKPLPLHYITFTRYDSTYHDVKVVMEKDNLTKTLGEVISDLGLTQLRIAETEKYPHVTFFFSGGRENTFEGEERIMIPSPKVATYDLQPEMSALEVTDAMIKAINEKAPDFICLNYANPDMVGHTGVYEAVVKAVETVDECVKKVVDAGMNSGYTFIITADHGNADMMVNPDGSPNTAHTTNPVPCFIFGPELKDLQLQNGRLADIAPTILHLMGIRIPSEMNGEVLIRQ